MKKEITIGELIATAIVLITFIVGFWHNTNLRLSIIENDVSLQKEIYHELKTDNKDIISKHYPRLKC